MEQKNAKKDKDVCLKILRKYTGYKQIKITHSGDGAIFAALFIAKQEGCKKVLIPDQGGWLTYKTFPKLLGLKVVELKTNYGIISPQSLEKHKDAALLYTSYAGYAAAQNVEAIYKVCKKQNILSILDASGALSHKTLSNGSYTDIILASFGKWKIADLTYGGFIGAKTKIITKEIKETDIFKLVRCKNMDYKVLKEKLKNAPQRLKELIKKVKEFKHLCKKNNLEILHEEKEGISIFLPFKSEEEKEKILKFAKKHKIPYKECPLYIKVNKSAISLEIKRL